MEPADSDQLADTINSGTIQNNQNHLLNSFMKFIQNNDIDPVYFQNHSLEQLTLRYFRIHPFHKQNVAVQDLLSQLKVTQQELLQISSGFPYLYSIPNKVKLAPSNLYKEGKVYGIDLSSAAVVMALAPKYKDHVLDMCCAPGAKLSMIADCMNYDYQQKCKLQDPNNNNYQIQLFENFGTLTGIDINANRLNIARNLIKKYNSCHLQKSNLKIELIQADGLKFRNFLQNPSTSSLNNTNLIQNQEKFVQYDKVLVDAECTHDGSIKHILKFCQHETKNIQNENKNSIPQINLQNNNEQIILSQDSIKDTKISNSEKKRRQKQQIKQQTLRDSNVYQSQLSKKNEWTENDFEERYLDAKKLGNISLLQLGLLTNGFELLKEGGELVYSTCSFDKKQNEDIICQFMAGNGKEAEIMEVFQNEAKSVFEWLKCKEGGLPHTLRLDPIVTKSGGMFICKIKKKINQH